MRKCPSVLERFASSDGIQGAKMSLDGSLFIETVSIMDEVWVNFGCCER